MLTASLSNSSFRWLGLSRSILATNFRMRVKHRASLVRFSLSSKKSLSITRSKNQKSQPFENKTEKENIYTIPNVLTLSRIFACPVLGWSVLEGNYHLASGLLVYAGLTDIVSRIFLRNIFLKVSQTLDGRVSCASV